MKPRDKFRNQSRLFWAFVVLILSCPWSMAQTVDGFDPNADGVVYALAIQSDGKILIGGSFLHLAGESRGFIGRLNSNGTLDPTFNPCANGEVYCFAVQENGDILVGGAFTTLAGNPRNHLARLKPDGSLDLNFDAEADSNVNCFAIEPNGRILIGGTFSTITGQPRQCIARLSPDGVVDGTFNTQVGGTVDNPPIVITLACQSDGKVLVGGDFVSLNGQSRSEIGRLNTNGTLDANFNTTADWFVASLAVQADGQIVAAGGFDRINEQIRPGIARLNLDGSLDTNFVSEPAFKPFPAVFGSLALQANGKILAGALAGGNGLIISNPPPFIYKYNTKGEIETNSSITATTDVDCMALQADGKILAGGAFTMLAGQTRSRFGRLNNLDGAAEVLTGAGPSITWWRGGSSPDAWRTSFAWSTNGTNWTNLGAGTHIFGGWQIAQTSFPCNATLRARAFVTGGSCNGSTWFLEKLLGPAMQPKILNGATTGFHGKQFGFDILGGVGRPVIVETSANLAEWFPLTTNVMSSRRWSFTDPNATNFPSRFYRVRSQ